MLSKEEINSRIEEIICSLLNIDRIEDEKYMLHLILSNSLLAINLVTLIEDELDFEFDDEDINLDFFSGISKITDIAHATLMRG